VLSYLREKNSGSALCHRIKLMCVGQANVGKTSLVEKLLSKSVTKPTESESGSARAAGRNAHPDDQDLGTSGASVGAEVNNKALSAVKRTDSERNRRWSYSEVEHGKLALVSSGGASGGDEWDGNDKSSSPASKARRRPGKRLDVATDGIRIRDWTAKSISRKDSSAKADKKDSNSSKAEGSKENIITFSSWDFAGQEIYYYTHLFFLSRRGIYLLIFNLLKPEEEASRIEYWLQSIHTRARGTLPHHRGMCGMCGMRSTDSHLAVVVQERPSFWWAPTWTRRSARRSIWTTSTPTSCRSSAASSRTSASSSP
jgi:GTPase SAR1 family protein